MKRMRYLILLASILISFFAAVTPAAAADDIMDNLLPQDTSKKQEGKVKLDYNEYPLSRYGMDTLLESEAWPWEIKETVSEETNNLLALINSGLWGLIKIVYWITSWGITETFQFDIIDDLSTGMGKLIQELAGYGPSGFRSTGLWPYLLTPILCLFVAWFGYHALMKQATSVALSGLLSTIAIMALSFIFFSNAGNILSGINKATNEIQNDLLSGSISAVELAPGKYQKAEGIAVMKNQIFHIMIKTPYKLLQFGTTDDEEIQSEWNKSGTRMGAILRTGTFSDEREEAIKYEVEELENQNMSPDALGTRSLVLALVLVMNVFMGIVLQLLAFSSVAYQIMVLVFTALTPVGLLIGLMPQFQPIAFKAIGKVMHALLMKVILILVVTIYFGISKFVYSITDPTSGYLVLFLLQIIILVSIWQKKGELIGALTAPMKNWGGNMMTGLEMNKYKQTYNQGKHYASQMKNALSKPATPYEKKTLTKLMIRPGVGVVNPMKHPMYTSGKAAPPPVVSSNQATAEKSVGWKRGQDRQAAPPVAAQQTQQNNPTTPPVQNAANRATPKKPTPAPVNQTAKAAEATAAKLNERTNLQNLESTTQKGGWAHNRKDNLQVKKMPALKDRLAERQAATPTDAKENPPKDAGKQDLIIRHWSDNDES